MGVYKSLCFYISLILLLAIVLNFQNCSGNFNLYGNGTPYEGNTIDTIDTGDPIINDPDDVNGNDVIKVQQYDGQVGSKILKVLFGSTKNGDTIVEIHSRAGNVIRAAWDPQAEVIPIHQKIEDGLTVVEIERYAFEIRVIFLEIDSETLK